MADSRLTLRCDCGAEADLATEGAWTCPGCGAAHVASLPDAHLDAVADLHRTHRVRLVASLVALLALALAPGVLLEPSAILLGPPAALVVWVALVVPWERRRRAAAVAALPGWRLG